MSEVREPPPEVRLAPPKTIVLWMDGKKYHTFSEVPRTRAPLSSLVTNRPPRVSCLAAPDFAG